MIDDGDLRQEFLLEAQQLVTDTEQCFLTLETEPDNPSILERIFRLAHNLKGSAQAVGFAQLAEFSHKFESFLLKLKKKELAITPSVVNVLLACNDRIGVIIQALSTDFSAQVPIDDVMEMIVIASQPPSEVQEASLEPQKEVIAKFSFAAEKVDVPKAAHSPDESIRVSVARVERLLNFVGELVILQTVLNEQSSETEHIGLRKTVHQIGKVTEEVQEISMSLRMVPLKQTFQKLQRIVRDTSSLLGKKIEFEMHGEDTELDKSVLESLGDPLVHLVRNAVDHGVESNALRLERGKPEIGHIALRAFHHGGKLVIEIEDDGAGLDANKLIKKAIEKNILPPGSELSERDAYDLIFASGFSTKTEVTDVSGRGVGMDVVKTNIERLQGDVRIDTALGIGTTFRVTLPLTLAIVDGMVIRLQNHRFVIPISHVHESIRPNPKDIHVVSGLGEIFDLRGENIPMYRLDSLLGIKRKAIQDHDGIVIVVRTRVQPFCIFVDDILGQQQIVIKRLGAELQLLEGFSGSAILGDGRPALILELSDIIPKSKVLKTNDMKGCA